MISVFVAPVWIASQISRGPIRVSLWRQLTAMQESVAQKAENPILHWGHTPCPDLTSNQFPPSASA